ncbi:MAG: hypothetical protein HC794_08040 [Nitrospiraceae bacterium]|nr:hypothetical protein [Nitrospiraceae bacterium]
MASAGAVAAGGIAAANAAALAATSTVIVPTLVSSYLPALGGAIGSYFGVTSTGYGIGSLLAPLATGTATIAAPSALTTAPLWVVLAGPVGWTLVGVGVLAVPFSWRLSKIKLRHKLEEACREQTNEVFDRLQDERLPVLRAMGQAIAQEIRIKLERQLTQVQGALTAALHNRPDTAGIACLASRSHHLRELLTQPPLTVTQGQP